MKILFVERVVEYIDPMNVELLSALAKRAGHQTFLSIMSQDDVEADVKRIKPDVVVFSAKTGEHRHYFRVNRAIKQISPSIITIIGGPHATFFPGLLRTEPFDAVGVGEGDDAWPDFLAALERGHGVDEIPNIITRNNMHRTLRRAAQTGLLRVGGLTTAVPADDQLPADDQFEIEPSFLRPRRSNLDDLPYLDQDLVYRKTHLGRFPMRSFMSSRGCPFECTYCFEPKFNQMYSGKGPIYNRYSVERLCAELKDLKARWPNTQFIKFYDDMFFVRKAPDAWLREFAEVYPREVGLPFFCLTRCNVLTAENLGLLKRAGLHSLTMSIEAGNEYIRTHVIKRHMTYKEIVDAFDLCHQEEIVTFANTILGIPVRDDIMADHGKTAIDYDIESLDINIRCRVTYAAFQPLYPYPGCELTEYAVNNGFFDGDFEKLFPSYNAESPFPGFSAEEKLMQNNLTFLGPICVMFHRWRWLRNVTVRHLIKWPLTKLYFLPWYLVHGYLNVFKVYPIKLSFKQLVWNIGYSLRNEWKKRAPGRRLYRPPAFPEVSPHQMLGGPPKN